MQMIQRKKGVVKSFFGIWMLFMLLACSTAVEVKAEPQEQDLEIVDGVLVRYNGSANEVILPDSVKEIGFQAFYPAKWSLYKVVLPSSVTSIGQYAFSDCVLLNEVVLPDSVTTIDYSAFSFCSALTNIILPDSVAVIEADAFNSCSSLREMRIPDGVTSIGESTFILCSSLEKITIPDSVTSIGSWAFAGCSSLKEVMIPEGVTAIEPYTFQLCNSLGRLAVPDSVTSIGGHAFYGCYNLAEIRLPENLSSMAEDCFEGWSGMLYLVKDSYAEKELVSRGYCYGENYLYYEVENTPMPTPTIVPKTEISATWQGYNVAANGEVYCETGSQMELSVCVTGVTKAQGFVVEIYDAYNNLINTINSDRFFEQENALTGISLGYMETLAFPEAGTYTFIVRCVVEGEVKAASHSAMLCVRNKEVVNDMQITKLQEFQGFNVKNFRVGNSKVTKNDNGLTVDGVIYHKYIYSDDANWFEFFVNAANDTLVTEYTVLQKLLYLDQSRGFLLAEADRILNIAGAMKDVLNGIQGYNGGKALSQAAGVAGNAILTGGKGISASLGSVAWGEVKDINNLLEVVVYAKYCEFYDFWLKLNAAVQSEKSGVYSLISDFEEVSKYMDGLNTVRMNHDATFELLKKVVGVPDSEIGFINWLLLYADYSASALETLTCGLSTELSQALDVNKLIRGAKTTKEMLSALDNASKAFLKDPVGVEKVEDISMLLRKTSSMVRGDGIMPDLDLDLYAWTDNVENIAMFLQWSSAIRQSEAEQLDYQYAAVERLDGILAAYDFIKNASENLDKPAYEVISGLPEFVFTGEEYVLKFKVNENVKTIRHQKSLEVASSIRNDTGQRILTVKLKIKNAGAQSIKLSFCNEQEKTVVWEPRVMACDKGESGVTHKITYDMVHMGDASDNRLGSGKLAYNPNKVVELMAGGAGNDVLSPNYGGTTYYLYYLDENNGYDTIVDNAGGNHIYLVGKGADINKVSVKYLGTYVEISYDNRPVIHFESGTVGSIPDIVAVADSAGMKTSLTGKKTVVLTGVSSITMKMPTCSVRAKCPVDLLVLDKEGTVVQTLKDGQESAEYTDYGMFSVSYDEGNGGYLKQVLLYEEQYSIQIVGNSVGTMKYQMKKAKADGTIETYDREGIEITENTVLTVDIKEPAVLTDTKGNTISIEQTEAFSYFFAAPESGEAEAEPTLADTAETPTPELEKEDFSTTKKETKSTSWILIAGVFAVIGAVIGIVLVIKKKKNKE